jgi:hypothetical protein
MFYQNFDDYSQNIIHLVKFKLGILFFLVPIVSWKLSQKNSKKKNTGGDEVIINTDVWMQSTLIKSQVEGVGGDASPPQNPNNSFILE